MYLALEICKILRRATYYAVAPRAPVSSPSTWSSSSTARSLFRITLRGSARGLTTQQVKRPKTLAQARQAKVKQGSYAGEEVTWEEAKRYAEHLDIDSIGGPDHEAAWKLAADMNMSEEVREATERYARWSAAAEYKALVAMGYSKE